MVKVTIEIDGSQTQVQAAPSSAAAPYARGDATGAPAEVLANAAAMGAQSAGPAPSLDTAGAHGPVASSIAGPSGPSGPAAAEGEAESAGAVPDHLLRAQS
jgi:hypothetical protein